jgi:membrane-associated protein
MFALSLDPESLIETFGTIGLFAIVFIESGLLVGFFLPGDSLLFTAGLLAAQDQLSFPVIVVGCVLAAIIGDQVGYTIGAQFGPRLLTRDRWYSRPHHVARAQHFFATHGGRAILLARFVPVARTFVPVTAGAVRMPYRAFVRWNVAGGLLWGAGLVTLGYFLGETIPSIDRYLLPIIAVIIILSILPALLHLRSASRSHDPTMSPTTTAPGPAEHDPAEGEPSDAEHDTAAGERSDAEVELP